MHKLKWNSKLIHMAVTAALVLSLLVIGQVTPVVAQTPYMAELGVTVTTSADNICASTDFNVTALIENTGNATAWNITADIHRTPVGGAHVVSGPYPGTSFNILEGQSQTVRWLMHCDAGNETTISVNATGYNATGGAPPGIKVTASGDTTITQYGHAILQVKIFKPENNDVIHVCTVFPLTFQITNTGTAPALFVNGVVHPSPGIIRADSPGDCGRGVVFTVEPIPYLGIGESWNWTVMMHCCAADIPPFVSDIHVMSAGIDYCTGVEIPAEYVRSDIVNLRQIYGVTCEAEDSKVGFNVTFNATVGTGAVYPVSWTWDFDDTHSDTGVLASAAMIVTKHVYTSPGTYNTTITTTDHNKVSANCTVQVVIYPELTAECSVTPYDFTKPGHELTFSVNVTGGFPAVYNCTPGNPIAYNWTWDFGDGTAPVTGGGKGAPPETHTYNPALNCTDSAITYTAVFTIQDDCLNNIASCNETVKVYPPLTVACEGGFCFNETSHEAETKVGQNTTFTGTPCGGIEDEGCNYTWTWDFGDNTTPLTGKVYGPISRNHIYSAEGDYNATFTIGDDCWNNTANCTVFVHVNPELTVACDAQPRQQRVCQAVNFTANATGGIPCVNYTWSWDFGDGTTSNEQNPSHAYMCTGNYTAIVTVCDNLTQTNCASCNVTVEITIQPPELYSPGNGATVTTGCNNTVCFEWEDVGCVNYTLQIWQKEKEGQKIWNINTGKNSTACVALFPDNYRWQVVAMDECGEWVVSDTWYVNVVRDCMYPAVQVERPNGGETFVAGTSELITWRATEYGTVGGEPGLNQNDLKIDIFYKVGAGNWTQIAWDEANDGEWLWKVPAENSTQCLVRVDATDANGNVGSDTSNAAFTITNKDITPPTVKVNSPNGGEWYPGGWMVWCGSYECLNWTATDAGSGISSIDLYLSSDGGNTWAVVALGVANLGCYNWTVPTINSSQCLFKVVATDAAGNVGSDTSNAVFTIGTDTVGPTVTVTRPNGGETFTGGTQEFILWSATDDKMSQESLGIYLYYKVGTGSWQYITYTNNDGEYKWTVPNVTSTQVLVKVVANDWSDNSGFDISNNEFTITTPAVPTNCTILETGWNLYSTPLIPDNTDIANVTAPISANVSIIWQYNATAGDWLYYVPGDPSSTLTTIEDGLGYWFYMNSEATLCIVGKELLPPPALPPTYQVVPGWNLIGFKSTIPLQHSAYLFNLWSGGLPNYSVIWGYDGSVPEYFNVFPMGEHSGNLEPGHGYWIWATAAGTIVPIS